MITPSPTITENPITNRRAGRRTARTNGPAQYATTTIPSTANPAHPRSAASAPTNTPTNNGREIRPTSSATDKARQIMPSANAGNAKRRLGSNSTGEPAGPPAVVGVKRYAPKLMIATIANMRTMRSRSSTPRIIPESIERDQQRPQRTERVMKAG